MKEKEKFSIQKELRAACAGKELSEAIDTFLVHEEGMLCIDPLKRSITLEECTRASNGTYYFFQNYDLKSVLSEQLSEINTSEPFLAINEDALPDTCPLQPRKHVVYICFP